MNTIASSTRFTSSIIVDDTPDGYELRQAIQMLLSIMLWFWANRDEFLLLARRANRVISWLEDWWMAISEVGATVRLWPVMEMVTG